MITMSTDILVLDTDASESSFREQVMFKELRGLNHGESKEAMLIKKINIKRTITAVEKYWINYKQRKKRNH